MRGGLLAAAALATVVALAGCAGSSPEASQAARAKAAVSSDLTTARTAVLKFLAANSGTSVHPSASSLSKYGFTPSRYTKDFEYFSDSGGVRYCIQATTPAGATFKVYIENDSKFSGVVSGACVAGTDY